VAALGAADLPVVVVNPIQTSKFAKSLGRLEKTDQIDANVLALFGERADVRQALYMATMSCVQHNDRIQAFYQRLIHRGKEAKVAPIAAARKLLVIPFALLKKQTAWDPNHSPATASHSWLLLEHRDGRLHYRLLKLHFIGPYVSNSVLMRMVKEGDMRGIRSEKKLIYA
jgi:transposase